MAPVGRRGVMKNPGGARVAGCSAVLLCILILLVPWFGVAGVSRGFVSRAGAISAETGWHELTTLRWLVLVTGVVAIAWSVLRVGERLPGIERAINLTVIALGGASSALLGYRVLIELPAPDRVVDQKLGAFVGLVAAIGVALGGYASMRETRRTTLSVVERSSD